MCVCVICVWDGCWLIRTCAYSVFMVPFMYNPEASNGNPISVVLEEKQYYCLSSSC